MEENIQSGLEVKSPLDTRLKYQYVIDQLGVNGPCPIKCKPIRGLAYRFVDSEVITENDFLPNELEPNPVFFPRKPYNDREKCMRCGISLYDKPESATVKLELLSVKLQEKYENKLIAIGDLNDDDGIGSDPNIKGHFSFYEYIKSKIYLKFTPFKHALR